MSTREELIARARQVTNEGTGRPSLPVIKFFGRASKNGEPGNYYLLTTDPETGGLKSEKLGPTFTGTILKMRHAAENEDQQNRKFIYEFDSWTQDVTMKSGNELVTGSYREIMQKNPDLSMYESLYLWHNGTLVKMYVSGGSLSNFYQYLKTFTHSESILAFKTIFGEKTVDHIQGQYHSMTFTRGEAEEQLEQLLDAIEHVALPHAPVKALQAAPELDENGNPVIKVDDIPF